MKKRTRRKKKHWILRTVIAVAVLFFLWYYATYYIGTGYSADLEFGGQGLQLAEEEVYAPGDFSLKDVPAYSGEPYVEVNGDVPYFSEEEIRAVQEEGGIGTLLSEKDREEAGRSMSLSDENPGTGGQSSEEKAAVQDRQILDWYGSLDALGRCTGAVALTGPETLPDSEREDVREIRPSGYHNAKYSFIENEYLYNRCHLIGFQLTGQNANERNLITGTRYLNIEGMKPFEDSVAQYIYGSRCHVLYRVTPVFEGQNPVCSGVLMEARSIEDPRVSFCVYCYNVQPGVVIDYKTGWSREDSGR